MAGREVINITSSSDDSDVPLSRRPVPPASRHEKRIDRPRPPTQSSTSASLARPSVRKENDTQPKRSTQHSSGRRTSEVINLCDSDDGEPQAPRHPLQVPVPVARKLTATSENASNATACPVSATTPMARKYKPPKPTPPYGSLEEEWAVYASSKEAFARSGMTINELQAIKDKYYEWKRKAALSTTRTENTAKLDSSHPVAGTAAAAGRAKSSLLPPQERPKTTFSSTTSSRDMLPAMTIGKSVTSSEDSGPRRESPKVNMLHNEAPRRSPLKRSRSPERTPIRNDGSGIEKPQHLSPAETAKIRKKSKPRSDIAKLFEDEARNNGTRGERFPGMAATPSSPHRSEGQGSVQMQKERAATRNLVGNTRLGYGTPPIGSTLISGIQGSSIRAPATTSSELSHAVSRASSTNERRSAESLPRSEVIVPQTADKPNINNSLSDSFDRTMQKIFGLETDDKTLGAIPSSTSITPGSSRPMQGVSSIGGMGPPTAPSKGMGFSSRAVQFTDHM